jgi:serine/threonine protein kinase
MNKNRCHPTGDFIYIKKGLAHLSLEYVIYDCYFYYSHYCRKIPNGEQNVEREIHLLQSLAHRNVMKLIEVFYNDEKGKIYLVCFFLLATVVVRCIFVVVFLLLLTISFYF